VRNFAFAPNQKKKKAESELDFFCWGGKKELEICQKRGQRKKKENVKFANGRGGKGVGDEAGGSLPWPQ